MPHFLAYCLIKPCYLLTYRKLQNFQTTVLNGKNWENAKTVLKDLQTTLRNQAVCVTAHKGSRVKLLLCLISIVTRSSSHLVREMNQTQGSKHRTPLPFLKNITEESDLENFQDLIVALDACHWLHKTISI